MPPARRRRLVLLLLVLSAGGTGALWRAIRSEPNRPQSAPTVFTRRPLAWEPVPQRRTVAAAAAQDGSPSSHSPARKVLKGQVIDGAGGVAGAQVHLGDATTQAGSDGRFSMPLEDAWTGLWASDEHGRTSAAVVVSAAAAPRGEVRLWLQPAAQLRVLVVLREGARPCAGERVRISRPELGAAVTDAEGQARFDGLPAGRVTVSLVSEQMFSASAEVQLRTGERAETVLVIDRAEEISGRVVDERGEGLPEATVRAFRLGPAMPVAASATTDAQGRFRVGGLLPRDHRLEATLDGYAHAIAPSNAPASGVTLVLNLGASVEGSVRLGDAPASGARVRAQVKEGQPNPSSRRPLEVLSDADGGYELAGLTPGLYFIDAQVPGVSWSLAADVDLKPGQRELLELTLTVDSGRVTGRVFDSTSGAPLDGATLNAKLAQQPPVETVSAGDGAFWFARLDGEGELRASAEGYLTSTTLFTPDGPPLSIGLARAPWVSGQVVSSAGLPVVDFRVDGVAFDDVEGVFLAAPEPTLSELIVSAPGFQAVPVPVKLVPGELLQLGTITLQEQADVRVRVVDENARPVAGALVFSTADLKEAPLKQVSRGKATYLTTTDGAGKARVPLVGEQPCYFAGRRPWPPSPLEACPMTLSPGDEVTLSLAAPGWAVGRVTSNSAPRAGVVALADDDGVASVTDADGRYRLGPFAEGKHQVAFATDFTSGPDSLIVGRTFVTHAGGETAVDVELVDGASLEVEVTAPEDGPVRIALIEGEAGLAKLPDRFVVKEVRVMRGAAVVRFAGLWPGVTTLTWGWTMDEEPTLQRRMVLAANVKHLAAVKLPAQQ